MNIVTMRRILALQVQIGTMQHTMSFIMELADQLLNDATIEIPDPVKPKTGGWNKGKPRSPESIAKLKATLARKRAERAEKANQ